MTGAVANDGAQVQSAVNLEGPFNLTCWYVNQRRLLELLGSQEIAARLPGAETSNAHHLELATLAAYKAATVTYIRTQDIQPLGQLLLSGKSLEGRLFTHYSNFWFKGLAKLHASHHRHTSSKTASGYAKLDGFRAGARIEFRLHPDHLTSQSAWGELSGQKRKLFFGTIQEDAENVLTAVPFVIADLLVGPEHAAFPSLGYWINHREVYIDAFDCFAAVCDHRPKLTRSSLDALKGIPEAQIKTAIAELIGEPHVPKDWSGERSDLFSTFVRMDGKRLATAFAFKGPAKFKPMTLAELGKNGDQIERLFSEPADLLVLQHCHEITQPVRSVMRAFAERMSAPRLFCIIDGYDTLRILTAYGKCGLESRRRR